MVESFDPSCDEAEVSLKRNRKLEQGGVTRESESLLLSLTSLLFTDASHQQPDRPWAIFRKKKKSM